MWFFPRMRTSRTLHVAALLALAACSKAPEPAAPAGAAGAQAPAPFSMRDLAAATAVDARLARFSLAAADAQAALAGAVVPAAATGGTRDAGAGRERARTLLAEVEAARAEVERAVAAVAHPADRLQATPAVAAARALSGKLAAAVTGDPAAAAPELFSARDALAAAITQYRASRAAWRLDAPEPQGAERDFAEARREMERAETAFGSRTSVAPREEGHELDAGARMTGLMAAERAKAAAGRLDASLREPAARYAAAQARALEAVTGLAGAPEAERAAVSRRYHAAKADALAALADYFAALAAR